MSGSTGLLIVGAVLPFIPLPAVAIVLGAVVAWWGSTALQEGLLWLGRPSK
jgi:hypothetical protein